MVFGYLKLKGFGLYHSWLIHDCLTCAHVYFCASQVDDYGSPKDTGLHQFKTCPVSQIAHTEEQQLDNESGASNSINISGYRLHNICITY